MKKYFAILLLVLLSYCCRSQSFRLIAPAEPLTVGEPFRVQYVVADGKTVSRIVVPDFSPLQLVSGPDEYLGQVNNHTNNKQAKNYVFTLVANNPGYHNIPGTTVFINNNPVSCQPVQVQVLQEQKEGMNKGESLPTLYLESGENAERKISKNLFVKALVNKRTCYTGEPVIADFKLYSGIETSSEVEKNPGFYGFTVLDKENLGTQKVTTEIINGRLFNVHTIRRVELYPLQAGRFFIDPMKVKNRIPVSLGWPDNKENKVYEHSLETETIPITALPLPDKNKPVSFSGGVGDFFINASIEKDNLSANEQGLFVITISGNGNLIQLESPVIKWPAGTEGFDARTDDSSDKRIYSGTNKRIFKYPFVCSAPGNYTIPAVPFSFFNIKSNRYQTIYSKEILVSVSKADKEELVPDKKLSINEQSEKATKIAGIIVLTIVSIVLFFWIARKKEAHPIEPIIVSQQPTEEILAPAYENINAPDNIFYTSLHKALWSFAAKKFNLTGSQITKESLKEKLEDSEASTESAGHLLKILDDCETHIYTNTFSDEDRKGILNNITRIVDELAS